MQERASAENGPAEWLKDALLYRDMLLAILEAPQPTVAVVQGPAIAGGVGIALACDLVLAAEDAYFALPEPQRGITASMVTPLLMFRVGAGPATRLLLSDRPVDAAEMYNWGGCHQVVAPDQLASAARSGRPRLARFATALAATKNKFLNTQTWTWQTNSDAPHTSRPRLAIQPTPAKACKPSWIRESQTGIRMIRRWSSFSPWVFT